MNQQSEQPPQQWKEEYGKWFYTQYSKCSSFSNKDLDWIDKNVISPLQSKIEEQTKIIQEWSDSIPMLEKLSMAESELFNFKIAHSAALGKIEVLESENVKLREELNEFKKEKL